MPPVELKVARIGNSRGVRIPAATLARYGVGTTVVMEERSDGILLRPTGTSTRKLSWEATAREMESAAEQWSEWDSTTGDGLEEALWESERPRRVAEKKAGYKTSGRSRRK